MWGERLEEEERKGWESRRRAKEKIKCGGSKI
jgi:hypothetical protein